MTRRKRYSEEFKLEALRRANEAGVTDVLVAEELGINARQLRRWREAHRTNGENPFPGQGNARDKEMVLLKRKLAKVEQERDFSYGFSCQPERANPSQPCRAVQMVGGLHK
jgi:transposase